MFVRSSLPQSDKTEKARRKGRVSSKGSRDNIHRTSIYPSISAILGSETRSECFGFELSSLIELVFVDYFPVRQQLHPLPVAAAANRNNNGHRNREPWAKPWA